VKKSKNRKKIGKEEEEMGWSNEIKLI